jgi:hypothetical protein
MRILISILCLVIGISSTVGQSKPPINKEDFLSAIKLGEKEKKTAVSFINLVNELKVDFALTRKDKQVLRRDGYYLGKKGLDSLIIAVRDNYRPQEQKPTPPTISQTMTNSPGGVQAGGNVIISSTIPPRVLTAAQENTIITALEAAPPSGQAVISCLVNDDQEPCNFARQLSKTLTSKAGWMIPRVVPRIGFGDSTKPVATLAVTVQNAEKPPAHALALRRGLTMAGIPSVGFADAELPDGLIEITVAPTRPDFRLAQLIVASEEAPSEVPEGEFPFALRLTVQTPITLSPVHGLVTCSGPIGRAYESIVGSGTHGKGGQLSYPRSPYRHEFRINSPSLTPDGVLEVKVFSLKRISCSVRMLSP